MAALSDVLTTILSDSGGCSYPEALYQSVVSSVVEHETTAVLWQRLRDVQFALPTATYGWTVRRVQMLRSLFAGLRDTLAVR